MKNQATSTSLPRRPNKPLRISRPMLEIGKCLLSFDGFAEDHILGLNVCPVPQDLGRGRELVFGEAEFFIKLHSTLIRCKDCQHDFGGLGYVSTNSLKKLH